jgi:hypothetical protein
MAEDYRVRDGLITSLILPKLYFCYSEIRAVVIMADSPRPDQLPESRYTTEPPIASQIPNLEDQ